METLSGVAAWFYEKVIQPIAAFLQPAAEWFSKLFQSIGQLLREVCGNTASFIQSAIQIIHAVLLTAAAWIDLNVVQPVASFFRNLCNSIKTWVIEAWNAITAVLWAVLPANRPFMAVVGDQRHGTNIEAPLTTIQEAVGLVMEEHISAMMAGFQALLEEQRAIRRTVENIQIGDDVIAQAVERYNRKMGMIFGL